MNSIKQYGNRLIERQLSEYLDWISAISLEGAKGVGKTSTAQRFANTIFRIDEAEIAEKVMSSVDIMHNSKPPILLDEWQYEPKIWERVRRQVDDGAPAGSFLLAGSAAPIDTKMHSGAGRIVRLRMRPLSLEEREIDKKQVSIDSLLEGRVDEVSGDTKVNAEQYVDEILSSGFPGIRKLPERIRKVHLDSYIANVIEREFPDQGLVVRKPESVLAWMRAYAAASASTASYQTILEAATPGEDNKPAKKTTLSYRDVLSSLWLLDPVQPWLPLGNTFSNLGKTPKHFMADPGLAARLLDISHSGLMQGKHPAALGKTRKGKTFTGRLFEALIAQSLQTYAETIDADLSHLRTSNGDHEVDFILQRENKILAIEVKFGIDITPSDVVHLNWLGGKASDFEVTRLIINTGSVAYTRRQDGIHVVPAAILGV